LEVSIGFIHDVEGIGVDDELIEDLEIVHLTMGHAQEHSDIAAQIQQRVQLDSPFVLSESSPGKKRQTQIEGMNDFKSNKAISSPNYSIVN
jgi:hypothetical protein